VCYKPRMKEGTKLHMTPLAWVLLAILIFTIVANGITVVFR
jgi:hypothetical protein